MERENVLVSDEGRVRGRWRDDLVVGKDSPGSLPRDQRDPGGEVAAARAEGALVHAVLELRYAGVRCGGVSVRRALPDGGRRGRRRLPPTAEQVPDRLLS